MSKKDLITVSGAIAKILGGGRYLVRLENGTEITAQLSGRMRRFHIRVIQGDRVQCGVSPYDPSHGFITYREPPGGAPAPRAPPPGGRPHLGGRAQCAPDLLPPSVDLLQLDHGRVGDVLADDFVALARELVHVDPRRVGGARALGDDARPSTAS